jgi:hypothetical protein
MITQRVFDYNGEQHHVQLLQDNERQTIISLDSSFQDTYSHNETLDYRDHNGLLTSDGLAYLACETLRSMEADYGD